MDTKDMTNDQLLEELIEAWRRLDNDDFDTKKHFAAVHAEILRRMGDGWVSVETRLPSDLSSVLCYRENAVKPIDIGEYSNDPRYGWCVGEGTFRDYDVQDVSHWMPLPPTPPKGIR